MKLRANCVPTLRCGFLQCLQAHPALQTLSCFQGLSSPLLWYMFSALAQSSSQGAGKTGYSGGVVMDPFSFPHSRENLHLHRESSMLSPNLIVECGYVVLTPFWKSHGAAWAGRGKSTAEVGGILAKVLVLSCICCIVYPFLQSLNSGKRLGWVVFTFPVSVWEDMLVSHWLTVSATLPETLQTRLYMNSRAPVQAWAEIHTLFFLDN